MFFIYQAECCISTDSLRNKREEVSLEGKVSLEAGCKSLNQASERDGGLDGFAMKRGGNLFRKIFNFAISVIPMTHSDVIFSAELSVRPVVWQCLVLRDSAKKARLARIPKILLRTRRSCAVVQNSRNVPLRRSTQPQGCR